MNNVGITTSVYANVVAPFSPVGKQAVGLENAEAREEVLPPAEEPAKTGAAANRKKETNELEQSPQDLNEQQVEERQQQQQQQQQQEDQQQIRELGARDREVRAHEQAHSSVGGRFAGAASFTFQRGPDGVNYAVGGEVPISFPTGGDEPELTLKAAEQVRRAALAPADPSAQDLSIAAGATQVATDARSDIVVQQAEEQRLESEEAEQGRLEKQQREEEVQQQSLEQEQGREAREQQRADLQDVARRSVQLSEQLLTLDNIQRDQNVGSVLDQLA